MRAICGTTTRERARGRGTTRLGRQNQAGRDRKRAWRPLDDFRTKLEAEEEACETAKRELAGRRESLELMERDRDLILQSYAALAPEALDALSPEERRNVYVILNLTVEALADGSLKMSGAFGEEPVWEDVRTSTR